MTINKQQNYNILGIDRGSKYIGLAYCGNINNVVFPLGYLLNDNMIYFSLSDIFYQHNIREIVIGWPRKQKNIQEKITEFINRLNDIIEQKRIIIHTQNEDYSSIISGEILSHTAQQLGLTTSDNSFKKNSAQDTISAMVILQRWKKKNKSK